MAIKDFEYMHGAVLTRILRMEEPLTLTLVENNKNEAWAAYRFLSSANNGGILYIKCSKTPRKTDKHYAWSFVFNRENLSELHRLKQEKLYLAFVCAHNAFSEKPSEICLLYPDDISKIIDTDSTIQQSVSVFIEDGKSMRVSGSNTNREKKIIERNRIDNIKF